MYNYKKGQYKACVTILYINKLIAKIRGGFVYQSWRYDLNYYLSGYYYYPNYAYIPKT